MPAYGSSHLISVISSNKYESRCQYMRDYLPAGNLISQTCLSLHGARIISLRLTHQFSSTVDWIEVTESHQFLMAQLLTSVNWPRTFLLE
uniref:Ovule protein n=1 Tax=Heterorhabditis bacteriophora TaxID=37862 RepID=A0A1I7WV32_HETBA